MTRAVFFDVDFTLIYPGPVFQGEGYREFCARHGVESCDPTRFREAVASAAALLEEPDDHAYDSAFFLRYIRHIIERMGGTGPGLDACVDEIFAEWAVCRHFSLFDDALPALAALRAGGLKLGLISNTHRSLDHFQRHFELKELISGAVSSSEHGFNKPHPSIFRAGLALLGVDPAEAVMVGDSYRHDIEGARAVGMAAILLRRGGRVVLPDDERDDPGVPVIASLSELPTMILGQAAA